MSSRETRIGQLRARLRSLDQALEPYIGVLMPMGSDAQIEATQLQDQAELIEAEIAALERND